MVDCALFIFNIFGKPIQNPIVNNSLLVKLFFRFDCELILFAGVEPLPAIKHIVEVTFYEHGSLFNELKPVPKSLFILNKLSPPIKKLWHIIEFFVEMLESLNCLNHQLSLLRILNS